MLQERVPALRRVAHPELLGGRAVKAAVVQEVPALGGARRQQLGTEELIGDLVGVQEACRLPTSSRLGPVPPSS